MKFSSVFLKFSFLLSSIIFFGLTSLAQLNKATLEELYRNEQDTLLKQLLYDLYLETEHEFAKLEGNDTLRIINDIYNTIFLYYYHPHAPESFFFLQSEYPMVSIGDKRVELHGKFVVAPKDKCNLKPMIFNETSINNVIQFVDSIATNSQQVRDYYKCRDKLKASEISLAKEIIADSEDREDFIDEYLYMPKGFLRRIVGFVPNKIHYLKFNREMTEVEVKFSRTCSGSTSIYKFLDGKWERVKVISVEEID